MNVNNDKTKKTLNGPTRPSKIVNAPFKGSPKNAVWITIVAVVVILAILFAVLLGEKPARSESYKDTSGAAGLSAAIKYNCDKHPCVHDFNVYIFNSDGRQVSVVQPDRDGKVHAALPEGNYVMIIGKQLAKNKIFPQEPLSLKNGKTLELHLQY